MNLHHVDIEDCADILERANVLDARDMGGLVVHVAEYAGNDVLIVQEAMTGRALIIEANDANYGGSIHDHARHARRMGTL